LTTDQSTDKGHFRRSPASTAIALDDMRILPGRRSTLNRCSFAGNYGEATPDGAILPGHWSALLIDAAATKTARRSVAARHGRAGAALLRPGERALTGQRITDHGRAARSPASPATRAVARATLGAALADRGRGQLAEPGTCPPETGHSQ
jgi:hypothetical protein